MRMHVDAAGEDGVAGEVDGLRGLVVGWWCDDLAILNVERTDQQLDLDMEDQILRLV